MLIRKYLHGNFSKGWGKYKNWKQIFVKPDKQKQYKSTRWNKKQCKWPWYLPLQERGQEDEENQCRQHTTKNIIQLIQLFLIVSIQVCCLNTLHRYRKTSDNRILNLITKKHHVTVSNKFNLYLTKDHLLHPTTFERWKPAAKGN